MSNPTLLIDKYTLIARFAPALITVLPLGLAFFTWFPPDRHLAAALTSVGGTVVLGILLGQIGRDLGKRKEPELFRKWGGLPSVLMLAHRTSKLNAQTLARYHTRLGALLPGVGFPFTPATEAADPQAAFSSYQTASDYLREATRDRSTYRLIFAENINYGFRRNLWGMKAAGITASVVALALTIGHGWREYLSGKVVDPLAVGAALACLLLLVFWMLRFTRSWVRVAADEYAKQLLAASEKLPIGEGASV